MKVWRWKRLSWLLVPMIVALVVLFAWLLSRTLPEAVDPTWERIVQTGILRVCTDPSWPPFEYINEQTGRIEGFDVDLARLMASRLAPNVQAEMVTVGFDSLYDALLAGRCDMVLSALPYESLRTQDVAYSLSYFNAGLVIVTREDTVDIRRVEELAGRVVGVEWGFVPQGDTDRRLFFDDLGLRRYNTSGDTLRALQSGELEAAVVDRISALAYVRDCNGVQISGEPIADVNYVVPVRPDSFRLLREIDSAVIEMREDGTLDALRDRWF